MIAAGAGDNAAAAVGTATVGNETAGDVIPSMAGDKVPSTAGDKVPSRCNISVGTSGTIFISSENFGVDRNNALHAFAHADGHYHLMGVMLSAASCNRWWMDDILRTAQYGAEQAPITRERLGRNSVFFLPYLMGERSPHNDPAARGAFVGLSMDTTREDMTQAILEGVAFGIRDALEAARSLGLVVTRSKICGGGAKSPLWKDIIASVLNLELESVETEEGPGYGGAILAAVACGAFGSVQTACDRLVKVSSTVKPDSSLSARYEERYQTYRRLYPALRPLFHAD